MIFISPPFGNYLDIKNTISIKGSFTLESRDGLYGQIFKTLRYSFEYNGWINKIGLRNKGIDYAIDDYKKNKSKFIYSIALFNEKEIDKIVNKIPEDMNIEINISCPNVDKSPINNGLNKFLNNKREWCIIKLSPLTSNNLIDSYYNYFPTINYIHDILILKILLLLLLCVYFENFLKSYYNYQITYFELVILVI